MYAYLCDGELGQGKAWNKDGAACHGGVGFLWGSLIWVPRYSLRLGACGSKGPAAPAGSEALEAGQQAWAGAEVT